MKYVCTFLVAALALCAAAQEKIKLTGDDKVITVKDLSANANGSITYSVDGKKKITVDPKTVDYAWVPAPKEILEADRQLARKEYAKADKLYLAAYEKYKFLGWEVYCIAKRAYIFSQENRLKDAAALLEQLSRYESMNPEVKKHLADARKLYLNVRIRAGELQAADEMADRMLNEKDPALAFFAFCRKGEIAALQNQKKKAVRYYLQAAYLFPDIPERDSAFYHAAVLLKELKDPRSKTLEEILKKNYPKSEYTKKL